MMDGVLAGKTGYTNDAGYCYVAALKRENRTFIVALLACGWPNNKTYKWKDTARLMEYGLKNYQYRNVYEEMKLPEISVINGAGKDTVKTEVITKNKEVNVLLRPDEEATIKITVPENIHAPVKKNQSVGNIIYCIDDKILKIYNIVILNDVKERNFEWCLNEICRVYLL